MDFTIQVKTSKQIKKMKREAEDKEDEKCLSAISTGALPAAGQQSTG